MPAERRRLARYPLHEVAVRDERVGAVRHDLVPGPVEVVGEVALGDRHAHGVREALTERARRHLDAGRAAALRVAGRLAPPLAERLEVVEREVVAGEVEERVEERAPVPGREHEPVAVGPARVARVVGEVSLPEHVGHGRRSEREPGVP